MGKTKHQKIQEKKRAQMRKDAAVFAVVFLISLLFIYLELSNYMARWRA